MLFLDRVFCDFCECLVGQVFNRPAQFAHGIPHLGTSPHVVVCPDCISRPQLATPVSLSPPPALIGV